MKISQFLLTIFCLFSLLYTDLAIADGYRYVKVQGRQLFVDFDQDGFYEPYFIKGVNYDPMPIGRHVSDYGWPENDPREDNIYNDDAILVRDFTNIRNMGANTIRIWKADNTLTSGQYPNAMTTKTLVKAGENNLKVIAGFYLPPAGGFYCAGGQSGYGTAVNYADPAVQAYWIGKFGQFIDTFKNRSEILFWVLGNENNLSLNTTAPAQIKAYYSMLNQMAALAHTKEGAGYHPVAIVEGDIHFIGRADYGTRDEDLPNIDLWGSNVYRGITFGTLFSEYQFKSTKPFYIGEYGADAFHANSPFTPDVGSENQTEQAQWDGQLWDEIAAHSSVTVGGTVMEYSDEWWKNDEWSCEDPADPNCKVINSSDVTFYWDARPQVVSYGVFVGSGFNFGNILNTATSQTSVRLTNVPTNVSEIWFRLSYYSPLANNFITEHMRYTRSPNTQASNTHKVKLFGSVHNAFGYGPRDHSCPLNGTIDFDPNAPDHFYHEEWWGLMSIAPNTSNPYGPDVLTPRAAYTTLQQRFTAIRPTIGLESPIGVLPIGTQSVNFSVITDTNALCKYTTIPGTSFMSMPNTFSGTGKQHSVTLNGLQEGAYYDYYVRCQDTSGNTNLIDFPVSFSVATTYESWKVKKFNLAQQQNPLMSGETADPDVDGIVNLLEYAFYLNPLVSDRISYLYGLLNGKFFFKYKKISASDLTYRVGASQNLVNWQYDSFVGVSQRFDDFRREVTATDTLSRTSGFFRLEVTKPGSGQIIQAPSPTSFSQLYTLTVNQIGQGQIKSQSGNIDCGGQCSYDGVIGTTEILTAQPEPGYQFNGWSGACAGMTDCVVTFNSPKTVQALFSPVPYCGDGVIDFEQGEECDGSNLNSQDCVTQGFSTGVLSCSSNCRLDRSRCLNYECSGTPVAHASLCSGDDAHLSVETAYSLVGECTDIVQCEMMCNSTFMKRDQVCTKCGNGVCESGEGESCNSCVSDCGSCPACFGTIAPNAALCSGDDQNLTSSLPFHIVSLCTDSQKCEVICKSGYVAQGSFCVLQPRISVPKNFSAKGISNSQIRLTWEASVHRNNQPLYYRIYQSTNGRNFNTIGLTKNLYFQNNRLRPGYPYYYKIQAFDYYGHKSQESSIESATTNKK